MNSPKIRRLALTGALSFALLATAACGETEATTKDGASAGDVAEATGASDPAADVGAPEILRDDFDLVYGRVAITNGSSERSDYVVTVVAQAPDGTTPIAETTVSVIGLDPGQTSTEKGIFLNEIPDGTVLEVAEVKRTASA